MTVRGAIALGLGLGLAALGTLAVSAAPDVAPAGAVVRVAHRDPDAPPTRGPLDAPVTIELFFKPGVDSKQPFFHNLEQLQARHPRRIRLVYRVIKAAQTSVSDAVLEALAQDKFFDMLTALDDSRVPLTRDHILEIGRAVGLDVPRLEAAMVEGRYTDVLAANEARHARLHGTNVPDALFDGQRSRPPLAALTPAALDELYGDAYSRAIDLVDRGTDPRALPAVFDAEGMATAPTAVTGAAIDDDPERVANLPPRLADPPLVLDGLPAKGPLDAAVPIVVVCQPASGRCPVDLEIAVAVQRTYPDDVRVVWLPWFDPSRRDAARLTMLADATLCAESLGDGWDWVEQMFGELARGRSRPVAIERTMDTVDSIARLTQLNRRALATCQAERALESQIRIAAARRSGVHVGPSVIVGGRIYPGGVDQKSLQALVEAELAPGMLGEVAPAIRPRRAP